MANKAFNYETETDDNGYFCITEKIGPLGPDLGSLTDRTVELRANLLEPDGIVVHATLDIDAADGTPSNQEKKFKAESHQETLLGSWAISLGESRTQPSVQNGAPRSLASVGRVCSADFQ